MRGWDIDDYTENNIRLKKYAVKYKAQNSKYRGNNSNFYSKSNFSKLHGKRDNITKPEKEVEYKI